eukprot:354001-Chlamydomonas_euryale.AAC.6
MLQRKRPRRALHTPQHNHTCSSHPRCLSTNALTRPPHSPSTHPHLWQPPQMLQHKCLHPPCTLIIHAPTLQQPPRVLQRKRPHPLSTLIHTTTPAAAALGASAQMPAVPQRHNCRPRARWPAPAPARAAAPQLPRPPRHLPAQNTGKGRERTAQSAWV